MQSGWETLTAISAQPAILGGGAIPIAGTMDWNGMLSGALAPGYVRPAVNPHVSPTVLSGSTMHSNPSPYSPHQALGYPFHTSFPLGVHQPIEPTGRPFPNVSLAQSYHFQPFQQQGSASQPLSLSYPSVAYGQSPCLPINNGGLGHLPQCASVPTQPQQAAVMATIRGFNPQRHFGALPQTQVDASFTKNYSLKQFDPLNYLNKTVRRRILHDASMQNSSSHCFIQITVF